MKKLIFGLILGSFSFLGFSQTILWEFNNTNDGWTTTNFTEVTGPSGLQLTATGANPKIAVSGQDIKTGDLGYYFAAITLRVIGDGPTLVRFGYAKNTAPTNFSYVNRPIANNSSSFVKYYIDLDSWSGRISDLLLEFKTNDGSATGGDFTNNGAVIEIDKIQIFDGDPDDPDSEPRKSNFDFNLDYDTDQWQGRNATVQGPMGGILTFQPQAAAVSILETTSSYYVIPTVGGTRKYLNITLKNESSDLDEIRVRAEFSSGSAIKSISTSDSGFKTYSIDLSVLPEWKGLISAVDISFVNNSTQLSSATGNILVDEISFDSDALGVNDINKNSLNVSLYPNPVKDIMSIKANETINSATIYNNLGQEVNNFNTIINNKLDLSSLNKGFYFITLKGNNAQHTVKIIKE